MTIEAKILKELETALIKEKNDLEKGLAGIAKPVDKKEGDYVPSFEEIGTDRDDNATEVEQYSDNLPVEMSWTRWKEWGRVLLVFAKNATRKSILNA
jgi:hypothetical protein